MREIGVSGGAGGMALGLVLAAASGVWAQESAAWGAEEVRPPVLAEAIPLEQD